MKAIANNPRSGWVRSDESIGPDVMKELSRLSSENSKLRDENAQLKLKKVNEYDESKSIIDILSKNKTNLYIWYKGDKGWADREPVEVNLLKIFEAIASNLIVENHNKDIASDVAFRFGNGKDCRDAWPVPSNYVINWLTDFHALDIVQPSNKKHPVADTKDYWTLTKKGRDVINSLRKLKLMAGIVEKENAPE